jgi:two-component system nitrogen regulation sensor histidine kinase NtrY
MMYRSFYFNLAWRLALLIITTFGIALVVLRMLDRESVFTLVIGLLVLILQVYFIGRYLFRINRILVSFIDSVGSIEASELQFNTRGTLRSSLELRLNQLKNEVTRSRIEQQKQKGLLDMVVDAMDTGLICINKEQQVVFSNKAAATLLQDRSVGTFRDIDRINPELANVLKHLSLNTSKMVALPGFKASVRSNNFVVGQEEHILYSIQNIQREVDTHETESWQKLIRVLTHEIMNGLGPVLSLSKSLKKSINQPDKILAGLETIENTGVGLIQFITEYRKLSTLPPPEKEMISVMSMFNRLEALFAQGLANHMKLEFEVGDPELALYADPHQIEQIMINLLKNAAESLEGEARGMIRVRAMQSGKHIQLLVEDNGPGIREEIRDQIFIPFFSTKKGGTGIGLSLSRQIMNNHEGTIRFDSVPHEKTIFTLGF